MADIKSLLRSTLQEAYGGTAADFSKFGNRLDPSAPVPRPKPGTAKPKGPADFSMHGIALAPTPKPRLDGDKVRQPVRVALNRPEPMPAPVPKPDTRGLLGDIGRLTPEEQIATVEGQKAAAEKQMSRATERAEKLAKLQGLDLGNNPDIEAVADLQRQEQEAAPAPVSNAPEAAITRAATRVMHAEDQLAGRAPMPTQTPLRNAVDTSVQTLANTFPDILKAGGIMAGAIPGIPEENIVTRLADDAETVIRSAFPADDTQSETFASQLAGGAGSLAGYFVGNIVAQGAAKLAGASTRVAGFIGAAGTGAAVQGTAGYEDAQRFGAGALARYTSFLTNAGLGLTEAIPIDRFFGRLNKASNGRISQMLKDSKAQSLEEFTQEVVQSLGSDIVARAVYDADREIGGPETLMQGIIGGILGGGMGAASGLSRRPEAQDNTEPLPVDETVAADPGQTVAAEAGEAAPQAEPLEVEPSSPATDPEDPTETAQDRAVLRKYGYSDADIDGMGAEERSLEAGDAASAGVAVTAEEIADATTYAERKGDGTKAKPVKAETPADVDAAASQAAVEPSQAQAEAGNYKHGHVKAFGFDIAIETPKGTDRTGTDPNGQDWRVTMPAHYGRIKRTVGADQEQIDVYLADNLESDRAYVVDQRDPDTGKFDEHKVILGANSLVEAGSLYQKGFSDGSGAQRMGGITEVPLADFKTWLKDGDTQKPFAAGKPSQTSEPQDMLPTQHVRKGRRPTEKGIIGVIREMGGIQDVTGELKAMDLGKSRPGTITRNGTHPDKIREAAAEQGMFDQIYGSPERAVAESTISDLYDLIDDHLRGGRDYGRMRDDYPEMFEPSGEEEAFRREGAEQELDAFLAEFGAQIPEDLRQRTVELLMTGAEADVDMAIERAAIMLENEFQGEAAQVGADYDPIPGFDDEIQPTGSPEAEPRSDAGVPEGGQQEPGDGGKAGRDVPDTQAAGKDGSGQAAEDGEGSDRQGAEKGPQEVDLPALSADEALGDALDAEFGGAEPDYPLKGRPIYRGTGGRPAEEMMYQGIPIAGDGSYWAFTRDEAEQYGPNIEENRLDLKNPYVVTSDEDWRSLTQNSGWEFPNPFGMDRDELARTTDALKQTVLDGGHDGIVIAFNATLPYDIDPQSGKSIKNLRNVFSVPQVVDYRSQSKPKDAISSEDTFAKTIRHKTEAGADGKAQSVIPGAEQASDAVMAQRGADAALKPKREQKSADFGLFGDEQNQTDLLDLARQPEKPKAAETGASEQTKRLRNTRDPIEAVRAVIDTTEDADRRMFELLSSGATDRQILDHFRETTGAGRSSLTLGPGARANARDRSVTVTVDGVETKFANKKLALAIRDAYAEDLKETEVDSDIADERELKTFDPETDQAQWGQQGDTVFPPVSKTDVSMVKADEFLSQKDGDKAVALWKQVAKELGKTKDNSNKVIFSIFDASGAWSKPFRDAGYTVLQYDSQLGDDIFENFPVSDIQEVQEAGKEVFGVLSACPCTTFTGSGARWWQERHDKPDPEMVEKLFGPKAAKHFDTAVEANVWMANMTAALVDLTNPRFHVLENPIGRIEKMARLPKPVMRFHPNIFGDPYTKHTSLYGDFSTKLPMAPVEPTEGSKIQAKYGSKNKYERSLTPEGFSYAFFIAQDPDAQALLRKYEAEADAQKGVAADTLSADDALSDVLDEEFAPPAASWQSDIANAKTGSEAMDAIIAHTDDADYKLIAQRIRPMVDVVPIKIVSKGDTVPAKVARAMNGLAEAVHYHEPRTGKETIYIRPTADVETVLHEYLHAATNDRLYTGNAKANADTAIGKTVADLRELRDFLTSIYKERDKLDKLTDEEFGSLQLKYAVSDVRELVAYGLSNRKVQGFLKSVKYEGGKTAWSKFVETLRKLLKIPRKAEDALGRLIELTDALLDADLPSKSKTEIRKTVLRDAKGAAKSAAKNTVSGLDEASKGLLELFGGGKTLGSGPVFDEDTYAKAKPHFKAAFAHFQEAASDLTEMARALVRHLKNNLGMEREAIEAMRPYLVRFMDDMKAGKETINGDEARSSADHVRDRAEDERKNNISEDAQEWGTGDLFGFSDQPVERKRQRGTKPGDRGDADREQPTVSGKPSASRTRPANGVQSRGGNRDGTNPRTDPKPGHSRDYRISQGELTRKGSWRTTAERNVQIVELVKKLDDQKRQPTQDERALLVQYTGWGASEIANGVFPNRAGAYKDAAWEKLGKRLKSALDDDEYRTASRSTQYAHYTSEAVIRSIYDGLKRIGFAGGEILEPGMGTGHFRGLMPDGMAGTSRYTGIEFDSTTAKIAGYLYPESRTIHGDFTEQKLPRDFFDGAVGNPPFAQAKILNDPEYRKYGFSLHDYFFAKTVDRVKPGGVMVFVTSRFTMDKIRDDGRKYLAQRANLLGAIRLPQTAFQANAGTEVVTDVLFLQKRGPGVPDNGVAWTKTKEISIGDIQVAVNEYIADHPDMVLGRHATTGSMYRSNEYTVEPYKTKNIEKAFAEAVSRLPEDVYQASNGSQAAEAKVIERDFDPKAKKEGGLYLSDSGDLMIRQDGVGVAFTERVTTTGKLKPLSKRETAFLKDFVALRDAIKQTQYDQLTDGAWEGSLKKAHEAYRTMVARNGNILAYSTIERTDADGNTHAYKRFKNEPLFMIDPDGPLAFTLEKITEDGSIVEGPIFKGRVLNKPSEPEIVTTQDAMFVSLDKIGRFDLTDVAARAGRTEAQTIEDLGSSIYETPGDDWVLADEYLSGDVVRKLRDARAAAALEPRYQRNVEALLTVQPRPLGSHEIEVKLGAPWVPAADVEAFGKEVLGQTLTVKHNPKVGTWQVSGNKETYGEFAMEGYPTADILVKILNNSQMRVTQTVTVAGKKTTEVNPEATEKLNDIARKIKDRYRTWIWSDPERSKRLVNHYNDNYNNIAPRQFDGAHLTLPGTSLRFKLHPHQKRTIWRAIQTGDTYIAHAVGAGKTFEMIAIGMEERRLGLSKKPLYVVPNHMLGQFSREFLELYPAANIMVADEKNFHTSNRRRFIAQAALNDPDAIIITHSAFSRIGMKPETNDKMVQKLIDEWQELRDEIEEAEGKGLSLKRAEAQIERLEKRLIGKQKREGKDAIMTFEELGVDRLIVDEMHEFRKLDFVTNQGTIKGIDPNGSQRAMDLFSKVTYLREHNPDPKRTLIGASGTPVTNTMGELFTVQRFFQPKVLEDIDAHNFDAWANQFGEVVEGLEQNAAGNFETVARFAKFQNVPELMRRVRSFMDILTSSSLGELVQRPTRIKPPREIKTTPTPKGYKAYQQQLNTRINAIRARKGPPKKGDDIILKVISDGRFSAIDMRFVFPDLAADPDSKLNQILDDVIADYQETAGRAYAGVSGEQDPLNGSTLVVFSDIGLGDAVIESRGFDMKAWITKRLTDAGIPKDHIAFIRDHKTHAKKERLFADLREGKKRILIGGKDMETGVNVQKRLTHLYHLDAPWFPASVEQREGRGDRQGNQNDSITIRAYATKGSYDSTMWSMNARKARFIEQALNGDESVRKMEDVSEASAFEMAAALSSGDPRYLQLAGLRQEVERLGRLRAAHFDEQNRYRRDEHGEELILERNRVLKTEFAQAAKKGKRIEAGQFGARIGRRSFEKRDEWSKELFAQFTKEAIDQKDGQIKLGEIGGYDVVYYGVQFEDGSHKASLAVDLPGDLPDLAEFPSPDEVTVAGIGQKAVNQVNGVFTMGEKLADKIDQSERRLKQIRSQIGAPFTEEPLFLEKQAELSDLEAELASEKTEPTASQADTADSARKVIDARPLETRVREEVEASENAGEAAPDGADLSIDRDPTEPVIRLAGDELGVDFNGPEDMPALRRAAQKWYDQHLIGSTIETADGLKVEFNRRGQKKTTYGGKGNTLLRAVPAIPDIIRRGVVVLREPGNKPNIVERIIIAASVEFEGETRHLAVSIHSDRQGHWHYDFTLDRDRDIGAGGARQSSRAAPPDDGALSLDAAPGFLNLFEWPAIIKTTPAGWSAADANPTPRLSQAQVSQVRRIVADVAGLDAVRTPDRITVPSGHRGRDAWSRREGDFEAQGYYDPTNDVIAVSMALPSGRRVAYHEAFHRLQTLFLTDTEQELLRREGGRLRDLLRGDDVRGGQVDGMSQREVEAEAFAVYALRSEADPAAGARGLHIGLRRAWNRILQTVRRVRNYLSGLGYQTYEDVFEKGRKGEIARRQPRVPRTSTTSFSAPQKHQQPAPWKAPSDAKYRHERWMQSTRGFLAHIPTMDLVRRKVQDRFLIVRRYQEHLQKTFGIDRMPEQFDVYQAESLYYGRAGERIAELREKTIDPLMEDMRAADIAHEDLALYLYAKHAPERNATIAERNPNMPDGGSGLTNDEAASVMAAFEKSGKSEALAKLASKVYAMNRQSLQMRYSAGLLSKEQFDQLKNRWKFYVPLRGIEGMDDGLEGAPAEGPRSGQGFQVKGKEYQAALGRSSLADSPLAYSIMNATEAITRAEKNRVGKTFLRLVQAFPNKKVWEIKTAEVRQRLNPETGLVEQYVVPLAFTNDQKVVSVKVGGKAMHILVHDPRLVRAMKNLGSNEMSGPVRLLSKFTRYYAALQTSWNPAFLFSNFFRDAQTALGFLGEHEVKGLRRRVSKNTLPAMKGMYRNHYGKTDDYWTKMAKRYREAGGKISFFEYQNVDTLKDAINADLNRGKIGRGVRSAMDHLIEAPNSAVENALRLATFEALVTNGMSEARAASAARELTVNFNRKGEWGSLINSFYVFFNASIQGNVRLVQLAAKSKSVRKAILLTAVTGFMLDQLGAALSDEDEDTGKSEWDLIPDWERTRSVIFPLSGGDFKMPLAYGFNIPFVFGQEMSRMLRGATNPLDAGLSVLTTFSETMSPVGGAPSFAQLAMPTVADPFIQIYGNENWLGNPIMPQRGYYDTRPDSQLAFDSVGSIPKWVATTLNDLTGGSKYEAGVIDISPETLELFGEFLTGGIGRLINRSIKTGESMFYGTKVEPNDVPFARTFYRGDSDFVKRNMYYDTRNEVRSAHNAERNMKKDGRPFSEIKDLRSRKRAELRSNEAFKRAEKELKKLRAERRKIEQSSRSHKEKMAAVDKIRDRELKVMMRAQKVYMRELERAN